jgi:predicted HTH domain antitoxin
MKCLVQFGGWRGKIYIDASKVMEGTGGKAMEATPSLEIPGEVLDAVRLPPKEVEHEFRKELALALYQRGALPLGKARLLAQMTHWEFEELLGERQIQRHYTQADLKEDIQYGLGSE